ncbi:protein of unknown function [Pseudomonas sp. JV241A]|nr:protein of unknown function [Pseudomonas sp. JV241A]
MDLCTPDLWEPALPAIEPEGLVLHLAQRRNSEGV